MNFSGHLGLLAFLVYQPTLVGPFNGGGGAGSKCPPGSTRQGEYLVKVTHFVQYHDANEGIDS